jgi:hypothetical protein
MKTLRAFVNEQDKENWLEKNDYVCEVRWINHELWVSTVNGYKVFVTYRDGSWSVKELE